MVSATFVAALGALASSPLAFAQYYPQANGTVSSAYPTGTSTPGGGSAIVVAVGKDGLRFTPDTVDAPVGAEISFQFFPKNHSVVQSNFENPCNPIENAIFSGFVPVQNGTSDKFFTIKVQDDKPVWLYCAQNAPSPHCKAGMVFAINPPKEGPNTLDAFKQLASAVTANSTAPSAVNGGEFTTPSNTPGNPSPSDPADSPGAAAALYSTGGVIGGLMGAFAALLL